MELELIVILTFCIALSGCVITKISIVYALLFGLALFLLYGRKQGFSCIDLFHMVISGIKKVKNILVVFVLIGMLTASWRMAGTIPMLVCYAVKLIHPTTFILMTFLLNCMVSVLTGTALGSAATMGVVCMTMGQTMGINPLFVGGAVLSGVYFGDRCSPVSTSALLVAEVTHTDIFANIKDMYRTAAIPFVASCIFYMILGFVSQHKNEMMDINKIFAEFFTLRWILLIPAAMILIFSAFRVDVKINMSASIIAAVLLSIFVQQVDVRSLAHNLVFGYFVEDVKMGKMINGGGIFSMIRVDLIVCLSSSYAGIFEKTGLLDFLEKRISVISKKITPFGSTLLTAIITAMITCNQTLSIMLSKQLCMEFENNDQKFAIMLANSSVVVAPLIPWSVAAVVPLTSISAPTECILFACFLYLLPMWTLHKEIRTSKMRKS